MPRQETRKLKRFDQIPSDGIPTAELRLTEELRTRRGWSVEEELQSFMDQDFYQILSENALVPDRHTYEVMIRCAQ